MHVAAPASLLANRRWWRRQLPFPHFVAHDVFVPAFFRELEAAFRDVLARGLSEHHARDRFSRNARGYDAYTYAFPPDLDGPLAFFLSRFWHDTLALLTGVRATGDVNGGLHHHEPASEDGSIHNDLNPGWFVTAPRADGVNPSRLDACNYNYGRTRKPGAMAVERTRAVAMIFFLNNGAWTDGDGGECGLYAAGGSTPIERVAPLDNSILVFECTPRSYHRFLSNRVRARDSAILWLHRERSESVARWGERAIVKWPK